MDRVGRDKPRLLHTYRLGLMRLCKISLIGKEDQKKIGYRLGTLRGRLSGGSSMLRRAPRFHKGLTICGVLACDRYGLQLGCTSHVEH